MLWNSEDDEDDLKGNATTRRVLLVEDNATLREMLANGIRHLGFEVVELGDGVELLEYFRGATSSEQPDLPDVVVAEVDLPGCSGAEACSQLRKSGAQVPFILLTPQGLGALHEQAVEAGADWVLDKPFSIGTLTNAVASAVRN